VSSNLQTKAKTASTIAEIKAEVDRALGLAAKARQGGDVRLLRHAVEVKLRAERLGGVLLGECSDFDLGKQRAARWRALAAMTENQFDAALESALSRQLIAARGCCYGIKMTLTPWFLDDAGFPTRILTAESDRLRTSNRGKID